MTGLSIFPEDTLTLFEGKDYAGGNLTIIEDDANVTASKGLGSAVVTG